MHSSRLPWVYVCDDCRLFRGNTGAVEEEAQESEVFPGYLSRVRAFFAARPFLVLDADPDSISDFGFGYLIVDQSKCAACGTRRVGERYRYVDCTRAGFRLVEETVG